MISRTFFSLLLLVIIVGTPLAALPAAAEVGLGPFLVLNSSSFHGDTPLSGSYSSQTNFSAGAMADYYLKDDVILSAQPMILQKGSDLVFKSRGRVIDQIVFHATYFSLPLMLKVTGTSRNRLYVSGGFELNILLSANIEDSEGKEDFKDGLEPIELGANFAVGGLIAVGQNFVFVEGRYAQGLQNIAQKEIEEDLFISIKTTGFMLIAGFLFQLGGDSP